MHLFWVCGYVIERSHFIKPFFTAEMLEDFSLILTNGSHFSGGGGHSCEMARGKPAEHRVATL